MRLTNKQHYALAVVAERNSDGTAVDFDQLLERLPWKPTKASTQFVIRALIRKGLILKGDCVHRREHKRRLFRPTPKGLALMNMLGQPALERSLDDVDDSLLEMQVA